jgi:gliding motility-associated-like protein
MIKIEPMTPRRPKIRSKGWLALLLLLFAFKGASSQTGTEFWFGAPEVSVGHAGDTPVVFRFSTFSDSADIRIQQPARYLDTIIVVPPNSHETFNVSDSLAVVENKPADTVLDYGFKITSDDPITAYYEINAETSNNPEIFALKARNALGTEFYTPFQDQWNNDTTSYDPNPYSAFIITATENNTQVFISPRNDVVGGHPANNTYSVTLDEGETYAARDVDANNINENLSGSVISSDKPVAVTVKDGSVRNTSGGCRDIMGDQLVPVNVIGKEYIVNEGSVDEEHFFVVATENNTEVTIQDGSGPTVVNLNEGDMHSHPVDSALYYIVGDKPIYVMHTSGFGCELGAAILPPLNCAGSDQLSFTRSTNEFFELNLLIRSGSEGDFVLNGDPTLINAGDFEPVPGTGGTWVGTSLSFNTSEVPVDTASLITNSSDVFSMGLINGSATGGCRYGYFSEFTFETFVDAGPDEMVCANADIPVSGSVSGGATAGEWSTLGSGTFADSTSLSTTYSPSIADTTNGSVRLVLSSVGTCDPERDTVKYTFTPAPVVDAGPNQTVCANDPEVDLNGSVSFASGGQWDDGGGGSFQPNDTDPNATFTPSNAQINSDSVTITYTSIGNGDCNAVMDSMTVTIGPAPQVNAGPDQTVCTNNDTVDLDASISGGTNTGQWNSSGTGSFIPSATDTDGAYLPSSTDSASGSVKLTLVSTNNGNCLQESDSLMVTIIEAPEVDAGPDDTICANSDAGLNGSVTGSSTTGQWSSSGTGSFSNPTDLQADYDPSASDTAAGSVVLTLTSTNNGSCVPVSDSIMLTITSTPQVNAVGPDTACESNTISLNGSSSTGALSWTTLGDGNFDPSDSIPSTGYDAGPTDTATGQTSIVLSSEENGKCQPVRDTLNITLVPGPTVGYTSSPICLGETVDFQDSSSFFDPIISYEWWFGDGDTSQAMDPAHTYSDSGTFALQHVVTGANGCTDTLVDSITVTEVQADFGFDQVCIGQQSTFVDGSRTNNGTINSWTWNFGDGDSSDMRNPQHTYTSTGSYPVNLIVGTDVGCFDTVAKVVDIIPKPDADFLIDPKPANSGDPVSFLDVSNGDPVAWWWDFGEGEGTANVKNPDYEFDEPDEYSIELIIENDFGCRDTIVKELEIFSPPAVPSGFSPNGDGKNDVLRVLGGPYQELEFKIFNNWGELIFTSNSQDRGWDGTRNGVKQPVGVYVYVVKAVTPDGKEHKISGDVTLLR